jgi:hypothetical protein
MGRLETKLLATDENFAALTSFPVTGSTKCMIVVRRR